MKCPRCGSTNVVPVTLKSLPGCYQCRDCTLTAAKQLFLCVLLGVFIHPTIGWPAHLLHQVPAAIAAQIRKGCEETWPNSPFNQGACEDADAQAWLNGRRGTPPFRHAPELTMPHVPDIMIHPDEKEPRQ